VLKGSRAADLRLIKYRSDGVGDVDDAARVTLDDEQKPISCLQRTHSTNMIHRRDRNYKHVCQCSPTTVLPHLSFTSFNASICNTANFLYAADQLVFTRIYSIVTGPLTQCGRARLVTSVFLLASSVT